jgi:hypothetical protein
MTAKMDPVTIIRNEVTNPIVMKLTKNSTKTPLTYTKRSLKSGMAHYEKAGRQWLPFVSLYREGRSHGS